MLCYPRGQLYNLYFIYNRMAIKSWASPWRSRRVQRQYHHHQNGNGKVATATSVRRWKELPLRMKCSAALEFLKPVLATAPSITMVAVATGTNLTEQGGVNGYCIHGSCGCCCHKAKLQQPLKIARHANSSTHREKMGAEVVGKYLPPKP